MTRRQADETLELLSIRTSGPLDGVEDLYFDTNNGAIRMRFHAAVQNVPAVLWVFGSGGGLGGPAGGLYERLGRRLAPGRAASLQVDYRQPGDLVSCVLDVLIGIEFLKSRGHERTMLVGHSFGGVVAINAALSSTEVMAVAVLSSQAAGAGEIRNLSPRPVFLAHGQDDEVLPCSCSQTLYRKAAQPKTLKLYPGCGHGLDACRDELDADLEAWLTDVLAGAVPRQLV